MKIFLKYSLLVVLIESVLSVIVTTQHGPVQGATRTTEIGTNYFSFQGIPYAQPPDGNLRFREPQPPISWIEPLNCTTEGPQFWGVSEVTGEIEGSFDSLHVNVFTKNLKINAFNPVMIFIHGGAYRSGSSSTAYYAPDYLIEKDVVVVTINYRLGAFGFLTLDAENLNVPGNAGLKDQRLALHWIQRNIAFFGGDPNRVMAFGHSAGGNSVHYQMISPGSENLFHSAYATGSNVLQNIIFTPRLQWAQRLAANLGLNTTDEAAILAHLEKANPIDIVRESALLLIPEASILKGYTNVFGPSREPYNTPGVFFSDELSTLLQNAWGNKIPFILGATSMENMPLLIEFRQSPERFQLLSNFENFIPREAGVEKNTTLSKKYTKMIKNNYYPTLEPTVTNIDGLLKVSSDSDLWYGIHRSVRYRIQAGNLSPTYVMRFDADTENSVFKRLFNQLFPEVKIYREPIHGDEFAYFFKTMLSVPISEMSYEGLSILQFMVSSLTNFAATGNPNVPEMLIEWMPVSSLNELLFCLNVRENRTEMMVCPESKRMHVFDEIFEMQRDGAMTLSLNSAKFLVLTLVVKFLL